jgi:acetyl-CoA carboxylase biotin carboxyl carrier protein
MIDIAKVERLMALMAQYGVDVVDAHGAGERIALARNASQHAFFSAPFGGQSNGTSPAFGAGNGSPAGGSLPTTSDSSASAGASAPSPALSASAAAANKIPDGTTITSPFVGSFYRAPSPDAPTFVEVGTRVRKGQTLCIVEAMKLMNEIESEVDGTVVAILMENAKPVEFGTPLFVVAP